MLARRDEFTVTELATRVWGYPGVKWRVLNLATVAQVVTGAVRLLVVHTTLGAGRVELDDEKREMKEGWSDYQAHVSSAGLSGVRSPSRLAMAHPCDQMLSARC